MLRCRSYRVWGGWETVHPASMGKLSQREVFPWKQPYRFMGGAPGGGPCHPAA